jgi:hypothetical protein
VHIRFQEQGQTSYRLTPDVDCATISDVNLCMALKFHIELSGYTGCPTRYRTRHSFNISNTNEDIATKFEQEYVRCVRNEKEFVCSVSNCCDTEQRSASRPSSVASGTHCIFFSFKHATRRADP